jgi:hypothetical protein
MTNSQRLATVRERLIRWMADHVAPDDADAAADSQPSPIQRESILIRDGFYCGRRFDLGTHRAVWFLEEDEVKIYGGEGKLLGVLSSDQLGGSQVDLEAVDSAPEPQILRLPTAASQPTPEPLLGNEPLSGNEQDDQPIRRAA